LSNFLGFPWFPEIGQQRLFGPSCNRHRAGYAAQEDDDDDEVEVEPGTNPPCTPLDPSTRQHLGKRGGLLMLMFKASGLIENLRYDRFTWGGGPKPSRAPAGWQRPHERECYSRPFHGSM
jgi:hypothetical protein